jgi:hypothetical protein
MIETFSDKRVQALANKQAKDKVRLRHSTTGELLHMSGEGLTKSSTYAWLGFRHQAEELQRRAKRKGKGWPFQPIHRDLIENCLQANQPDLDADNTLSLS